MSGESILTTNPAGHAQTILQAKLRFNIGLMRPIIDEEMVEAGVCALRNERLVMGESVHKFEEEFARYCRTRYADSTGSETAGQQIAFQLIQVKNDDEVLSTPVSFFPQCN